MKKLVIILMVALGSVGFCTYGIAESDNASLNKISLQLQAEKWATTKTAKVIVGVDATLSEEQLGQIHSQIMRNLTSVAAHVDWHITQFIRNKGQSGLEQLHVQAQARVPEADLAKLRANAKAISKPGKTYRILAIQFNPSQAEIENTRADLRQQLYNETKAELTRLNKIYPKQNYYLHAITFNGSIMTTQPAPRFMATMVVKTADAQEESPAMSVSSKVRMTANAVLASKVS